LPVLGGAREAGADWAWLPPLCADLGAYLGQAQRHPFSVFDTPELPRSCDVTRRVGMFLAGTHDRTPALTAVARDLAGFPRLTGALTAAVRHFRTAPHPVLLHGRCSPAFVLATPANDGTAVAPATYVVGWLEAARGPSAYDAGYFIGELIELAVTAGDQGQEGAVGWLTAAVRSFYHAYAATAPPSVGDLPRLVTRYAALKIVEHVLRFATYYGEDGVSAGRLLSAADAMLSPEQGLMRLLDIPSDRALSAA
jgi:hypothetical protein